MIWRYINNIFAVVLLLCGLMILTFACEREDIPGSGGENTDLSTGEPVSVNFMVSEMGVGKNEIIIRNTSFNPSEGGGQETVAIPVSDDIFMYATLTENINISSVNLRSLPLDEHAKVRVVAYTIASGDTINSGYADYEVNADGSLNPISHPLFVLPGTYNFVAYSFHNAAPLATFADTTVLLNSTDDVIWGKTSAIINAYRDTTLHIDLNHLSSQVRMQVSLDSIVVGTTIHNVVNAKVSTFSPRLIVRSGKLNFNAVSMELVPCLWEKIGMANAPAESYPLYVFSNNTPFRIEIDSVWIDNAPYSGPYIIQLNTPLVAGRSYSLTVNFTRNDGCADILYLAADGTLSVGKWKDGQINMGNLLFFKFGSVIGFTAPNPPTSGYVWNVSGNLSLIKYNPTNLSFSQYTRNNGGIPTYSTSTDWPGVTNVSASNYHNVTHIRQGRGDPCKLANRTAAQIIAMSDISLNSYNSGWRLATASENIDFVRAPSSWYGIITNPSLSNTNAKYWGKFGGVQDGGWFPITGNREATTGRAIINTNSYGFLPVTGNYSNQANGNNVPSVYNNVGYGIYWSGDVYDSHGAFRLLFDQQSVYPNHIGNVAGKIQDDNFNDGHPVRCVRITP